MNNAEKRLDWILFFLEDAPVTLIHTITLCFQAFSEQLVKDVRKMI